MVADSAVRSRGFPLETAAAGDQPIAVASLQLNDTYLSSICDYDWRRSQRLLH